MSATFDQQEFAELVRLISEHGADDCEELAHEVYQLFRPDGPGCWAEDEGAIEAEPGGPTMTECPDGAQCHRECVSPKCIRVATCGPMSRVFPSDRWPDEIVKKHGPGVSGEADTSPRPRVWRKVDLQPCPEDVRLVLDCNGFQWRRLVNDQWVTGHQGDGPCGWPYLIKKFGPLTEVLPVSSPSKDGES